MINRINMIITHRCNLNCKHCYMSLSKAKQKDDLTIKKLAFESIDKFVSLGLKEIMITGGEITVFSYIKDILKYAKEKGLKTIIFTNGFDFDFELLYLVDQVNISIDGLVKTHNFIRNNSHSFEKIIILLEELKKRDKYTVVQITIGEHNIDELERLSELLISYLNIRLINLNNIIIKGNSIDNNIKLPKDINRKIQELLPNLYKITKYHIQFKTSSISKYDFYNNYVQIRPNMPIWVDLIDEDYYIIKHHKRFSGDLSGLNLKSISKMQKELHQEFKRIYSSTTDFINVEEEIEDIR